jgi:hypothetical protein
MGGDCLAAAVGGGKERLGGFLGEGSLDPNFLSGTTKTMKFLAKQNFMKNSMKYKKILKMV